MRYDIYIYYIYYIYIYYIYNIRSSCFTFISTSEFGLHSTDRRSRNMYIIPQSIAAIPILYKSSQYSHVTCLTFQDLNPSGTIRSAWGDRLSALHSFRKCLELSEPGTAVHQECGEMGVETLRALGLQRTGLEGVVKVRFLFNSLLTLCIFVLFCLCEALLVLPMRILISPTC